MTTETSTETNPPSPPTPPATPKSPKPPKAAPHHQPLITKPKVEEIFPWAFSGKTLGRASRKSKSKPSSEHRPLRQKQSLIPRGKDRFPNNEGREYYRAGDVLDFAGRVVGYDPKLVLTPDAP